LNGSGIKVVLGSFTKQSLGSMDPRGEVDPAGQLAQMLGSNMLEDVAPGRA
jgi:hypothetical protein